MPVDFLYSLKTIETHRQADYISDSDTLRLKARAEIVAPERVNSPYRQIADMTDVALGTVDLFIRGLKEMEFLVRAGANGG
jgi:hypothetical protein